MVPALIMLVFKICHLHFPKVLKWWFMQFYMGFLYFWYVCPLHVWGQYYYWLVDI